jgi:hypothetical protein
MNARLTTLATALALAAVAPGCTSTDDGPKAVDAAGEREQQGARPWTAKFQEQSILIANEVSIEGPPGLIDHVAIKQLPEQKYSAKTTADGFLQEISVDADAANPIWIQVDNLAINAVVRARVLERVTDGPVRIRAKGAVTWKNLETGAQQDSESFEIQGERPR